MLKMKLLWPNYFFPVCVEEKTIFCERSEGAMPKTTLKASQLREGQPKRVELEGKGILVAMVGGNFYAIGDKCTHRGCSLSDGTLEGTIVTCPCHGSKFDIANGKVVAWVGGYPIIGKITSFMKKDEPVYQVTMEGDEITISD
ncbi:MAG: Rieske 2Fe-2S domain-containing protein [Nitrosomonas communis]|nr:Rieske 2Fe-2S domain-containing protein [Nitrosomonas communis]